MENGPQPLTAEEEEDLRTSSDILTLSPPMTRRLWATLDAARARAEEAEAERDAWKVRAEKAEDEVCVLRGLLQML